jgi:uncharacterized protein (DUF1330 family)
LLVKGNVIERISAAPIAVAGALRIAHRQFNILTQTVTDPHKYGQEYVAKVMPFLAKHKTEVIVAEMEAKPLQGDPAKGVVVLRFPSEQAIQNFVSDPDDQPIKKIRMSLTNNANAVMAPEFKIPV